ncbi:MAG TPA: tetratricopeptide repeat protein [Fibrobacteria bacterium]|nr:tetratricopeptide repeat protein [Fibrobacteria bacterium]
MNLFKQTPAAKAPEQEAGLVDWFMDDFWPRFGKQSVYVLVAIAVVVAGVTWYNNDRGQQQGKENKELGQAYVYFSEDKRDSAEKFLASFVKTSHSRLVQDKANLMLGQIHYSNGKYEEAIKAFSLVDLTNTKHPLISSGALHGLASSYIQNKNYPLAAETLEKFVSTFGRRSSSPTEKVAGKEVVDLSPAVPNALWKLTLVYRELKNPEKEKATAAKLVSIYPESRESFDATRLLAQIP